MMEPILERRISNRAFTGQYLLAWVAGGALGTGLALIMPPLFLLCLLPPAGVFVYARLAQAGSRYRLFPDRMEVESGIISRKIENVELFRVRDVGLRQGLLGRMANYGDIYLHSTDSSTPDLHLRSVDAPKEVYEEIRALVSESRAQHRTMIVEQTGRYDEG